MEIDEDKFEEGTKEEENKIDKDKEIEKEVKDEKVNFEYKDSWKR